MVEISPAAIAEIERIKLSRQISDICFRLTVRSGGCLDFFYSLELDLELDLDQSKAEGDRLIQFQDISLAIDSQTWKYVEDLRLDYAEDLMGGGFRFHNPQIKQTCGCGISFTPSA